MENKIKRVVAMLNTTANVLIACAGLIGGVYTLYKMLKPNKGENEA